MLIPLVTVVCAGLVSCANSTLQGYDGPPRPDDETFLVRAARNTADRLSANIEITSYDSLRGDLIPVSTRSVRLLEGDSCLGILATSSTMDQESAELCFYGEAGEEYEIRVLVSGIPQDMEDTTGGRQTAYRGPFSVDSIWIVNSDTSSMMAIAVF
jgi:hypothetical protein